jgi:hypothetical protein
LSSLITAAATITTTITATVCELDKMLNGQVLSVRYWFLTAELKRSLHGIFGWQNDVGFVIFLYFTLPLIITPVLCTC